MPRGGARPGAGRKPAAAADVTALIEGLTPVKIGRAGYTRTDQYRDFHRVFYGTAEGKRVLAQLVDMLEGRTLNESELTNHALLAARAWARKIGLQVLAIASVPPPPEEAPDAGQPKGR